MSLKLKRNLPLILSLLAVVLVLVLAFGNLRVGATNVRLGTWTELRVSANFSTAQPAGELTGAVNSSAQAVIDAQPWLETETNN